EVLGIVGESGSGKSVTMMSVMRLITDPNVIYQGSILYNGRHPMGLSQGEGRRRAMELLAQVGIPRPEQRIDDYPHQFSGGMRQRVMIALALSCNPDFLIATQTDRDRRR